MPKIDAVVHGKPKGLQKDRLEKGGGFKQGAVNLSNR